MEQIQHKANQGLWEAATRYERARQQQDLWEGACTTALQQTVTEFSPLLSNNFETHYPHLGPAGQTFVVNEARGRTDEIFKF